MKREEGNFDIDLPSNAAAALLAVKKTLPVYFATRTKMSKNKAAQSTYDRLEISIRYRVVGSDKEKTPVRKPGFVFCPLCSR